LQVALYFYFYLSILSSFFLNLGVFPVPAFGQTDGFRESFLAEPGSFLRLFELALAHRRAWNLSGALLALDEVLRIAPRCPAALLLRGEILLDLGRYEAAREAFQLGDEAAPEAPDGTYGLIKLNRALLNWERVLALCKRILSNSPDNAFAVLNSAWAHFNLRNYEDAVRLYDHPVCGKSRVMRLGKGWSLLRSGKVDDARVVFQSLLKELPTDLEALRGKQEVESALLRQNLPGWRVTAALTPEEAASFLDLASRAASLGKISEALDLWGYVMQGRPDNASACLGLAGAYSSLGNWGQASYYYSVVLNRQPDSDALRGKIRALGALGQWADAASLSADLLKKAPADALALSTIAYFRYLLGDFAKACGFYERAGKDDSLMLLGRAWCKFMLKDFQASRNLFKEVLQKEPANVGAIEGLKLLEKSEEE